MRFEDLIRGKKYSMAHITLGSVKIIVASFSHIEDSGHGINRAYFNGEDGLIWIVPFLSIIPVTPISSLEAELW